MTQPAGIDAGLTIAGGNAHSAIFAAIGPAAVCIRKTADAA